MRPALPAAALVLALLLVLSAAAKPKGAEVSIQYAAYGPDMLDVLPGQTVTWTNVSERTHTVTAYDGLFDSGHIAGGERFSFTFSEVGSYRYHCTIHPSIGGEIDVRRVTLEGLPTAVVPRGTPVEFDGVSADPSRPIVIQRRLDGDSFAPVGHAKASEDGRWTATLPATGTGDYRAVSGTDVSETRRLLVSDRHVLVHPTRRGLSVTVSPSAPYAPFLVEVYLRDRFGWWPVARGHTDYVSEAEVRVRRPARVRVVLVDRDGWTPLATSRSVTLERR
ncbi:MAG TPA: cupredoxin domain-containing protein [Gaiellaceae bacterium]|nr:cupredoxin domain-containing protein [Gaiellaceae bacterium]